MTKPLDGQIALVTGAKGGLGAAIAVALAELGATLIVTGRKPGDCAGTVAQVVAAGGKAADLALDVSDLAGIPARVKEALALHGAIDILVNNAATIGPQARLGEIDALEFDAAMRVNISGPTALVSALWPELERPVQARRERLRARRLVRVPPVRVVQRVLPGRAQVSPKSWACRRRHGAVGWVPGQGPFSLELRA